MKGHIPSEWLSAYLDGETAPAEARELAAHLDGCADCRGRLEATRRLVGGLRLLAPAVAPPPEIAARLRARIAATPGGAGEAGYAGDVGDIGEQQRGAGRGSAEQRVARWLRSLRSLAAWLWWRDLPPLRSSFSAPLGVGLALLVTVLLVENGSGGGLTALYPGMPHARPEFLVSAGFGDASPVWPQTTSQVAGRVFVLSDDVWVQRGLDAGVASQPRALVPAHSPAGRALLAKFSDLGVLLADGSRVVMRDNRETLELWNGS
jgi:hypothetical protein